MRSIRFDPPSKTRGHYNATKIFAGPFLLTHPTASWGLHKHHVNTCQPQAISERDRNSCPNRDKRSGSIRGDSFGSVSGNLLVEFYLGILFPQQSRGGQWDISKWLSYQWREIDSLSILITLVLIWSGEREWGGKGGIWANAPNTACILLVTSRDAIDACFLSLSFISFFFLFLCVKRGRN